MSQTVNENPTGLPRPLSSQSGALSLVGMIAAHAASSPQALAVSAPDARLSYRDLARCSDRLAQRLRVLGAGVGSRVALCLPRSAAMIVGALAVFKAGGAYVSLDPSHPAQRLAFALNDSGATIVLTDKQTAGHLPQTPSLALTIDSDMEVAENIDSATMLPESLPEGAAYVIYTSGSTGRQRGVEISRSSLLNLVQWHIRNFRVVADDRATQIASPAFDASVWEIWPYLAAGASLHIPTEDIRWSYQALRDYILDERITIAFVPTALAERMITLPWPGRAPLRAMLTGGDTLHHYPPANLPFTLVNNYGPTEATVVTTSGAVIASEPGESLPGIGAPIDNCRVYILDEQLRPVAAGVDGEICIGGAGVALGYLNNHDLTQEKFIADPFSDDSGGRLYRSGDRGRMLPGGEVVFLGRMDDQIKLRGYRIEPQEIVSAINSHPTVVESVVTLGRDESGETCIVAHLVPANPEFTRSDLVEFLSKKLPPYMIPAVFVAMDSLPITDNGKIDRASLPRPGAGNMLPERTISAVPSGLGATIASIMRDLLRVPQISAEENFFLLGGHSLLGTQVIAKLRDKFGVELPLRVIFEHPTVAELSVEVEKLMAQPSVSSAPEAALASDEWSAA